MAKNYPEYQLEISTQTGKRYYVINKKYILFLNLNSSTPIREDNSNQQSASNIIPILTNYEEIEVPYIFTRDLESYENKGWREPNIRISDYFNYGKWNLNYLIYLSNRLQRRNMG